jgi:hypothetical protein
MKTAVCYTIALACCIGLALADWDALGYGGGYGGYGGMGASLGGYGGYGKASYVPVYPNTNRGGIGNGGIIASKLTVYSMTYGGIFGSPPRK